MGADERVLLIGATRGTGLIAAQRLLQEGYQVRGLARDPARAARVLERDVEILPGDVTKPATLAPAVDGVDHIIYTAGVTRRPAPEALVKATVYDGVRNTIAAATRAGFAGRFVLMGAIGTTRGSPLSLALNLIKGNTLKWRRRAEEDLRRSGLGYTVVHAGILTNAPAGRRGVDLGQAHHRMWPWYRIGRADAAEVLIQAMRHQEAGNTTFDAVWTAGGSARKWDAMFRDLKADVAVASAGTCGGADHSV